MVDVCDIAHVLMLERVAEQDRDEFDEWLMSDLEYVTVDPKEKALRHALGLAS